MIAEVDKVIEVKCIPKSEGNMLGSILFSSLTEYFNNPLHQEEFEEWKRNREREQCTT